MNKQLIPKPTTQVSLGLKVICKNCKTEQPIENNFCKKCKNWLDKTNIEKVIL